MTYSSNSVSFFILYSGRLRDSISAFHFTADSGSLFLSESPKGLRTVSTPALSFRRVRQSFRFARMISLG
ncbi:MAG: hypothetical protein BWK80_59845 [Desulfobacteraceae bacterium IS3]|nr:MAG: hypothetical protein BWK80_59845 [Desulfobacteraceae bacterium IS3]